MGTGAALIISALLSGGFGLLGAGISSAAAGKAGELSREATEEANKIMNQQWKEALQFEKQKEKYKRLDTALSSLGGYLKDSSAMRNNFINIWAGRRGGI